MKLYYAHGACSLSPHIVLREAGFDFDIEQVDLGTGKTATGIDFKSINPKGYVPALELDDGEILTEGAAIVQYLADQKPDANLAPPPGSLDRFRVGEWLIFVSSELHQGMEHLFNPAFPDDARTLVIARVEKRFDYLDDYFKDRSYLWNGAFTIADAYCFTVLGWTKYFDIDLGRWANLKRYSDGIAARPSVLAAVAAEAA